MLQIVLFVVGLLLIVKGGDSFVDAAAWIAEVSGIPKLIVGATIVSMATTLPELLVSLIAAAQNSVGMAVGNAIGSVSANTGLILALSVLFLGGEIRRRDYLVKSILLLLAAVLLLLGCLAGWLSAWCITGLLLIFMLFMRDNLLHARKHSGCRADHPTVTRYAIAKNTLFFLLGAVGIVFGSQLLVDSGSALATTLGVPESIIAVTLVAIGTSLPELVTTLSAIAKKQASLSVGNIIGANLIDLTLILPLCSLCSGRTLPISWQTLCLDLPVCIVLLSIALVPTLIVRRFQTWQGQLMLTLYLGYLVLLFL